MVDRLQPLQPAIPLVLDDGRPTTNGYDFLNSLWLRAGGSLGDLDVSSVITQTLTVTTGVTPDGGGLKHGRVTTGSIGAGVSAVVTLTWTTAFADANYTVNASVLNSTAATASLKIVHIETQTAAAVTVRVENTSAGALTGTLHVIAIHD